MGKARLAPVREISIPRLELTAAVISVKLSKIIRDELDMNFQKVFYRTDSMSVLKCINNESKRFHVFESNRLTVIHNGSSHSEWHYVNRDNNPADDGSKGLKLDDMLTCWLRGPEFLWKNESLWPRMVEIPALKDDDPEVRKETQIYTVVVPSKCLEPLIARYSSWWKLKRAVAWLLRYKAYLLLKVQLSKRSALVPSEPQVQSGEVQFMKYGYLKVAELLEAEKEILKEVPQVFFPQVIEVLSSAGSSDADGCVKKVLGKAGTMLHQLNPHLEDGLLRVRGQLASAPVPYEKKHPYPSLQASCDGSDYQAVS
ncbi:uncharacterized protein [Porites lutea]|uniref:uncharacterized protein n=1 Tax=Porites lutea TaxID=51062 RepID=UPI003CC61231